MESMSTHSGKKVSCNIMIKCICIHCFSPVDYARHRQISRDRLTKYGVFLEILTNFPFPFCFDALSFLPKEIRDLFVNYSGNNKEYSELAQSLPFGFVI